MQIVDRHGRVLAVGPARLAVAQAAAGEIMHDRERDAVVLADVDERNDVRMASLARLRTSRVKRPAKVGVVNEIGARQL